MEQAKPILQVNGRTVGQSRTLSRPELLAPGGSLDKCRIAFLYGADAVYAAGKNFGLRGFANNLDDEEIAEAVFLAHLLGKKIYITVNVFAREADLKKLPAYLSYLHELGVDALIISDPGVLRLARRHAPGTPVHLSTQANTTNSSSILFWRDQGVSRVNLARELSFPEIAEIAEAAREADVELEVFVHGAMCISYSGRCLVSAFLNGRPANSGFCTQPCRWSYSLVEEKRPGEYFPVFEDSRGTYIFNSKDLCLIEHLDELAALGIRSFKIEGRMKGALYLASVTRAYRGVLGRRLGNPELTGGNSCMEDLLKISHRPYTKGFLLDDPSAAGSNVETQISYVQTHTLAGIVRALPGDSPSVRACLEVRSRLSPGREVEFLFPDGSSVFQVIDAIEDLSGNPLSEAHPNRWIRFPFQFDVFPGQVVRTLNPQARTAGTS